MEINLNFYEMLYLLEGCLRGSHLRSSTVERFVNEWYDKFTVEERARLYEIMLRNFYNGNFKPDTTMCEADEWLMARYNPNNQYRVYSTFEGKDYVTDCFKYATNYVEMVDNRPLYKKSEERYFTKINTFIASEYITKIEKIENIEI